MYYINTRDLENRLSIKTSQRDEELSVCEEMGANPLTHELVMKILKITKCQELVGLTRSQI
jgi:hypothetical protein